MGAAKRLRSPWGNYWVYMLHLYHRHTGSLQPFSPLAIKQPGSYGSSPVASTASPLCPLHLRTQQQKLDRHVLICTYNPRMTHAVTYVTAAEMCSFLGLRAFLVLDFQKKTQTKQLWQSLPGSTLWQLPRASQVPRVLESSHSQSVSPSSCLMSCFGANHVWPLWAKPWKATVRYERAFLIGQVNSHFSNR